MSFYEEEMKKIEKLIEKLPDPCHCSHCDIGLHLTRRGNDDKNCVIQKPGTGSQIGDIILICPRCGSRIGVWSPND